MAMCVQGPGWSLEVHASPPVHPAAESTGTHAKAGHRQGAVDGSLLSNLMWLNLYWQVLQDGCPSGQVSSHTEGNMGSWVLSPNSWANITRYHPTDIVHQRTQFVPALDSSFYPKWVILTSAVYVLHLKCVHKGSWGIHILARPWGPICNPPGTPSDLAKWVAVLPPAKLILSSWSQSPAYTRDQTAEGKSGFSAMATGWIQFIWWGTF